MDPLRHLEAELAELAAVDLLREPRPATCADGQLALYSNDYLGYAAETPRPTEPVAGGAGASRLISGDLPAHLALEHQLCRWLEREGALVFSSGYAANVGTISALAGPDDLIVSDAANHASLIDGCRLSGARVTVVPHLDTGAVARALSVERSTAARCWVITESYFSMAGASPDLVALRRLCDQHDAALVVDEAHAIGVFGPRGRGLCARAEVVPDVLIGTLGKALGLQGAFVAGSDTLRRWLWTRARTFMFSTGLSPWLAAVAVDRVARAADDEPGRARLAAICETTRRELERRGAPIVQPSHGPILFWRVGEPRRAVALSQALREQGILAPAIRPPTVPEGGAGIRITLHARLTEQEQTRMLAAFRSLLASP